MPQKVYLYLEYHSVCPSSEFGPLPLPQTNVSPHPRNRRGAETLACGWGAGVGSQFGRLEKKPSTLSTLYYAERAGGDDFSNSQVCCQGSSPSFSGSGNTFKRKLSTAKTIGVLTKKSQKSISLLRVCISWLNLNRGEWGGGSLRVGVYLWECELIRYLSYTL